ncbi:MAG: cyclic-di-AMP receptor [Gemmatimonadaceae bacterium]
MDALNDRGISVTRFVSSGGLLQHKNVTLMSGIEDDRIEEVLGLIMENCRTRSEFMNPMPPLVEPGDFFVEVRVGGATVFIMNVDRFEKL